MLKLAGKIALALLASLLVWEILLRIFIVVPIPYRHDPQIGWMPKPYSSGLFTMEGRGVCNYNEFGFRGDAIGEKKPGELRIVALGDSYTEGQQMNIEQTYPARLERLLNEGRAAWEGAEPGQRVRVLNGGRGGSSPAYSVQLSEEYKRIFQPDWVVILINDGNWVTIFDPGTEIYYRPEGDTFQTEVQWKWNRMSPYLKLLMRWRVRDLAIFQYTYNRLGTTMAARARVATLDAAPARQNDKDSDTASADAVKLERAVDLTVRNLRERYPKLVMVHIPVGASTGGLSPPLNTEGFLVKSCERYGVPLIVMRDRIVKDYAQTSEPPFGFYNTLPWVGHPNAHGHALVADALYEFFARELKSGNTGNGQ